MEELEDRRLLATFVVNNLFDLDIDDIPVVGSLRQVINLSNASVNVFDTIVFADFITPGAIFLNGGEAGGQLTITDSVNILGPGADALTIHAGGNNRIFETNIGADDEFFPVTIGGMTLTGGSLTGTDEDENRGGAIFNRESLTIVESVITGNFASQGGGGIFQPVGSLRLERSLVANNSGGGGGGGILNGNEGSDPVPSVTIRNSTISNNTTFGQPMRPGFGGGVFNRNGSVTIQHSTISENSSSAGGGGVATYGIGLDDDDAIPIITTLSHTIAFGNSTGGGADDLFAVRFNIDGDLLIPVPRISDFNFIGMIGGTSFNGGGNRHFYEVVPVPDGLDWTTANRAAGALLGATSHLATPSSAAENDFVFDLVDDPALWLEFEPTEPMPPPPPQNIGPWLGGIQTDTSMGAPNGWEWVTAPLEDFNAFTAWAAGQPDDAMLITAVTMPPTIIEEDRLAFFTNDSTTREATWGDLPEMPDSAQTPLAFVIEYDQGTNFHGVDPQLLPLGDYGGATRVYYPISDPALGLLSPTIDGGNPNLAAGPTVFGEFFAYEQRGRHFTRIADSGLGIGEFIDIGAVEVQSGQFRVDTLVDEADNQYSRVWEDDPFFGPLLTFAPYESLGLTGGDFSLREAVQFSEKNPEVDTILFEPRLDSQILLTLDDPTLGSAAPTILLSLRSEANSALLITQPVTIQGPKGFEVEIDATGNDPTPGLNNADGSRIFLVDNFDFFDTIDVAINDLTLLGGDVVDSGGAVLSRENLSIATSTIKFNASSNDGGGVFSQLGNLVIEDSTLHDNASGDDGGAIFVDTGTPGNVITANVRNSTISGNTSGDHGGGIYNANGEVLVEFSTITLNIAASTRGAGIASLPGPDALTQVHSSIVSANLGGDIEFLSGATNIQSMGFNLIGDGNAAVVFNQPGDTTGVLDPKLAALLNTGGPTATHRLLPGSPAIDTGDTLAVADVGGVPEFDQRGDMFTRVFDGLQDTKDRIDIGAYELQSTLFIVDNATDENDGDISADNFSLREAVELANANPFADIIMFAPTLFGQTIFQTPANDFLGNLQPGTPTDIRITDSVSIIGLGQSFLTLDGSAAAIDASGGLPGRARFFTIDDGNGANDIQVTISDIKILNNFDTSDSGGTIKSVEELTLQRVQLINNSTLGDNNNGGAIHQRYGSLTLDNVTLSANSTDGVDADGGAVYVRDADLTVTNNSSISGNSTTQTLGTGGGIYLRNGTLDLSYSSISNNLAPGGEADGAGLFGYAAVLNIVDSTISGNSMTGSNSEGAGIFSSNSALYLTDSVVSLNRTTGTQSEGAGIYLNGGTASIDNSIISLNSSTGLLSVGAGIAIVNGGQLLINASTLDSNTTTGINASGGAVHNLSGDLTILDSTISNNAVSGAGAVGGGIFTDTNLMGSLQTTITNTTISGNSSDVAGGGIYNADGLTVIEHSTITNNDVPNFGFGGGVASFGTTATRTDVHSTIISGNTLSDVDRVGGVFANSFQSLGFNLIGTGLSTGAFNNLGDQTGVTDPMLGLLALNGGPTLTHDVLLGSPAINLGDPGFDPVSFSPPLVNDQRGAGFARVVGGQIDIGAVESVFAPPLAADFDIDGDVDGADFLAWQRGLGTLAAVKSDGDADNDADVDNVDLSLWEATFGNGVAAVAASTSGPLDVSSAPLAAESLATATTSVIISAAVTPDVGDRLQRGSSGVLTSLTMASQIEIDTASYVDDSALVLDAGNITARDASLATFTPTAAGDDFGDIAAERELADDDQAYAPEDDVFASLGAFGL